MADDSENHAHLSVGLAVRSIRERRKLTQEDVAYESGLSLRHYQKIEAGTVDMRLSTLWRLADVLEVAPHALIERVETRAAKKG